MRAVSEPPVPENGKRGTAESRFGDWGSKYTGDEARNASFPTLADIGYTQASETTTLFVVVSQKSKSH